MMVVARMGLHPGHPQMAGADAAKVAAEAVAVAVVAAVAAAVVN